MSDKKKHHDRKHKDKKHKKKLEKAATAAGFIAGIFSPPPAPASEGTSAVLVTRDLFSSIHLRRSNKAFKPGDVDREQIGIILEAAVRAPNHKMTEPWGFIVLGPQAKRAYAETKARLKYGGDSTATDKALKVLEETMAIPTIIAVTQKVDDNPVRREEDYAAVFMAVQNMLLAATSMGLGTKVHTGDILDDAWLRDALHVNDRERIVAYVDVGQPADEMPPKKRIPAGEKTRWLP